MHSGVEDHSLIDQMKAQFAEHQRVVTDAESQCPLLLQIAERLIECFRQGGKLLLLGNGGSAADAQHIAAELVGRFRRNRRALPAIALTTDTSILTAVANDFGAVHCFERQIEALATDKDVVWALSVSGKSPNVIAAVEKARQLGVFVIGFTGREGAMLGQRCDLCFMVNHDAADRVQEVHLLAYHLVCDQVERAFA